MNVGFRSLKVDAVLQLSKRSDTNTREEEWPVVCKDLQTHVKNGRYMGLNLSKGTSAVHIKYCADREKAEGD